MRGFGLAGFAVTVLLGIGDASAIEITQVRGKFSCPDLQNQQECAWRFEKALIAKHPSLMTKENGRPKIRLQDGSFFSFAGKGEDSDTFDVLEVQANGRFVVVRQQLYEGNSWQLLDLKTGSLTEIYGYPLFSPNQKRFVSASEDLEAGYSDNVLDVYQVSDAGVTRAFRAIGQNENWAARNVSWHRNDVIFFDRVTIVWTEVAGTAGGTLRELEIPASLSLENGKWMLHQGRVK